jgi:DtxR family Mn-dependent transcriptional regulator
MARRNIHCEKYMVVQKTTDLTESEAMYLISIARLVEMGAEGPIPLSKLAKELSVLPVSANQMVRKLVELGYVKYHPYKGVEFLSKGLKIANHILRHRRLWEVFLVDHLHLSPLVAENLSCRMEHITPCEVADMLYEYLERPSTSPLGKPIPEEDGELQVERTQQLTELKPGEEAEVLRVEVEPITQDYLDAEGVRSGCEVRVLAVSNHGGMLFKSGSRVINLSKEIAEKITLKRPMRLEEDLS